MSGRLCTARASTVCGTAWSCAGPRTSEYYLAAEVLLTTYHVPRRDGESLLQCSVQATSHAPLQLYRLDSRDTPLLLAGAGQGAGHAAPDTRHVSPAGTRYTCTQHSAQGVRYFTEQGTQTLANGYSTRWGQNENRKYFFEIRINISPGSLGPAPGGV